MLALPAAACASLVGVQDAEITFPVPRHLNGSFSGWTEITVDPGPASINKATLLAVTLDVERPAGTPDLSFLQSIVGEAVLDTQRTVLVTGDNFPSGEQAMPLQVKFQGDLLPFFKDGRIIRIEWTGRTNPSFTNWPADGFTVRGRIKVDVE
jgi:hypothetical protein